MTQQSISISFYEKSLTKLLPLTFLSSNNFLTNAFNLYFCSKFLKKNLIHKYEILSNLTGYQQINKQLWYIVVYNFLSTSLNKKLNLKILIENKQSLTSISSIYFNSNWFERELWDLLGIFFSNHPDLRRILTDYAFEGHPLDKTFPLMGYVEYHYSDQETRLIPSLISFSQNFR